MSPLEWFLIISTITLAITVFEFTRRKELKEDYSLLWLLACAGILIATLWRGFRFYLSNLLGVGTFTIVPVVIIGAILLLVINLHFSVKISKQSEQIQKLAEEVAILKYKRDKEPQDFTRLTQKRENERHE